MAKLFNLMRVVAIITLCIGFGIPSTADDTEIYQKTASASPNSRPKVLIVFDDSGSMRTEVTTQPPAYDPTTVYPGSRSLNRLYFSTSNDDKYVNAIANRCAESFTALATAGIFIGKLQRSSSSSSNRWRDLRDNSWTRNATHLDCEADIINNNPGNGTEPDGYPCEGNGGFTNWYCNSNNSMSWGDPESLYTGNYVNWFNSVGTVTRTRLEIAKDTVVALIHANPAIDFGLALFNDNDSGQDGGRIVNRIITDSSIANRATLINNVNAIEHSGWTPLCESTYEAYRYLAGLNVLYGDDRDISTTDDAQIDIPDRDRNAEAPYASLQYKSPITDCNTFIIIMTDGEPSKDSAANNRIEALTNKTCNEYADYNGNMRKNCLPELAEYMANNDLDNDTTNGDQYAMTYTIGFATSQQLLEDTAIKGKGLYKEAQDATSLAEAFQDILTSIIGSSESFTSPAVAVDTFSRTESRDDVFFAMFEPEERVNWKGNIKGLKISIDVNGEAKLLDANGDDAFDTTTGRISSTATTYWSPAEDGDKVDQGGLGALLTARDPATRTIWTNTNTGGGLQAFNDTNINTTAFGFSTTAELFTFFEVTDQADLTATINWARGMDVDDDDNDGNLTEALPWILADMLHSRPIIINYGARGSYTTANPDQRLIVGTNGGFLHMFGINNGEEDWAFFPKELGTILKDRRTNLPSSQHIYGIDSPLTTYILDKNGDGTINKNSGDGDLVYVYFGLRRGGRNIYALDITDPDSPKFLWKIAGGIGNFTELGQTWSVPTIIKIPYDHDNNSTTPAIPRAALVFGAGYDTNKDITGVATADSVGRGIFIVDVATGALIWHISPATNSSTNLQELGLSHSIPSIITTVDSNGDELIDRLYFGDTGGNVWRVDMPGVATSTWKIIKLADFNDGTTATDRRFFNAPDVVRTKRKVCTEYLPAPDADKCKILSTINFDAVLIGSGDRTNPNATDVDNQFYMIRDQQLIPYNSTRLGSMTSPGSSSCNAADKLKDFRCFLPFSTTALFDVTANLIQTGDASQQSSAITALESAHGWRLDLSTSGEKSLARAVTLYGSVFFTTFSPNSNLSTSCKPLAGQGLLYQVNLHDATASGNFLNFGGLRTITLGSLIPDTPSPHFGSDNKIRLLFPSGGGLLSGNPLDTGAQMPQPYGIYWYKEEL